MLIELDEDVAIQHVTEHLKTSHKGTHTHDEIEAAVATARTSLETVPVRSDVPVLVERRARRILCEHAGQPPVAPETRTALPGPA